jgi:hypothetical protein
VASRLDINLLNHGTLENSLSAMAEEVNSGSFAGFYGRLILWPRVSGFCGFDHVLLREGN